MILFYSLADAKSRGNCTEGESGTKIFQCMGERGSVFERKAAGEQGPVGRGEAICGGTGLVPEAGGTVIILNGIAARLHPERRGEQQEREQRREGPMLFQ